GGRGGSLDGRPDQHFAARGARNRALDEQQVALGVDADDLEVLRRAALLAQVARHLLAREHAPRRLALADRARRPVRHGVTVRHVLLREVVALDHAGVTLALRRAGDVDELPGREEIDLDLGAGGVLRAFAVEAELDEPAARLDLVAREVTGLGLRQARGRDGADRHLDRAVTVALRRADARHPIGKGLDYADRDRLTGLGENAGHAAFSAH